MHVLMPLCYAELRQQEDATVQLAAISGSSSEAEFRRETNDRNHHEHSKKDNLCSCNTPRSSDM